MKTNLLCTFVHKNDIEIILEYIQQTYKLDTNVIFVLSHMRKPYQMYCTYNVVGDYNLTSNTILVHRKSDTNTLYTINALNDIIRQMNNGVLDTSMQIPWDNYRNTLILSQGSELTHIPLKLEKIHRITN